MTDRPGRKTILSIGITIRGGDAQNFSFRTNQSLLDADIIIFSPTLSEYHSVEDYNGRRLITEIDSFRLAEDIRHWRLELRTAVESGKTVFTFLPAYEQVYAYTGEKTYSGTGRNQKTTELVAPRTNYEMIPIKLGQVTPKSGRGIRPATDLKSLASYWQEFGPHSHYEVYLAGQEPDPLFVTKVGGRFVGGIHREGNGAFVLLPLVQFPGREIRRFGKRFVTALVHLDEALRFAGQETPPPDWVDDRRFTLETEHQLLAQIQEISAEISVQEARRANLVQQLEQEGDLRRLLYETGHLLERAIVDSLKIMGFEAKPFRNAESEFDVVFESPEGRLLGEAEGKDNRAINIDKLSQLERNLQEDFAREDVVEYAKGVLFGNGFRLMPLAERGDFFTAKCRKGAQRLGVALVRTPDLFFAAKRLKEHPDAVYAKACRESVVNTSGDVVIFPVPEDPGAPTPST